jgi:hypothetical protein
VLSVPVWYAALRIKVTAYTQDLPGLHLTRQQRAVWKFVQVAALLPQEDGYYEDLPPAARMAVDAVREVARQLEPSIKPTKGKGHD